jgi:chemotaxis protein methyltransferase CheR
MREYTQNYIKAGGQRAFLGVLPAKTTARSFSAPLVDNVVFAQHNLVSGPRFNEFHGDHLPAT